MALILYKLSWDCPSPDPDLAEWRIYVTQDASKRGTFAASMDPEARTVDLTLEEGEWIFRVVATGKGGLEIPWQTDAGFVSVTSSGRGEEPSAPTQATVLPVDPGAPAVVQVEPPSASEEAQVVQVIEGPDEFTGKLIGEVRIPPGGPRKEGAPLPSAPFPLGGSGRSSTRTLLLATRSEGGARGAAATAVSVAVPERAGFEGTLIASVDISGGTHVGFQTADSAKGVAFAIAKGFYSQRLPLGTDAAGWASLGAAATGWRFTSTPFGPFPSRLVATTDEYDLGSLQTFFLECFDQVQRTGASALLSIPGYALSLYRGMPGAVRDLEVEDTDGPAWAMRHITGAGKNRRPLIGVRWEYVVGASSNASPSESDWKILPPGGGYLSGRYVRARLVVRDPVGFHSVMSGNCEVYVRVARVDRRGAGSPEGVTVAPPGSRYLDTTANELYVKETGLSSTGWVNVSGGAPSAHATSHQHGGSDEVATATPGANALPKAGAGGTLAAGWLPALVGDSGAGGTKGAAPAPAAGDAAAGKYLKADGTWAVPASTLDITGLTAETAPADADAMPIYDASATANRKVTLAEMRAYMAEHIVQTHFRYGSTASVLLYPFTGSLIEVNGEIVDVGAGFSRLSSANLITATGADAGAACGASTLYYAYVSNSQASFSPSSLRLSTTVPTGIHTGVTLDGSYQDDFYLGTSGNARHWRFVGMCRTDGSTLFQDTMTQRLVASYYNRLAKPLLTCPGYSNGSSATSYTTTSTTWTRANGGTGSKIEWLSFGDEAADLAAHGLVTNSGANTDYLGIGIDSTSSAVCEGNSYPGNTAWTTVAARWVALPTVGYHYAELLIRVSAGTGTYYADDARGGASADPYATYLSGIVRL